MLQLLRLPEAAEARPSRIFVGLTSRKALPGREARVPAALRYCAPVVEEFSEEDEPFAAAVRPRPLSGSGRDFRFIRQISPLECRKRVFSEKRARQRFSPAPRNFQISLPELQWPVGGIMRIAGKELHDTLIEPTLHLLSGRLAPLPQE